MFDLLCYEIIDCYTPEQQKKIHYGIVSFRDYIYHTIMHTHYTSRIINTLHECVMEDCFEIGLFDNNLFCYKHKK